MIWVLKKNLIDMKRVQMTLVKKNIKSSIELFYSMKDLKLTTIWLF